MYLSLAFIISGIALLVWSADRFTDGASALARNFGISPLIVGLTIVAIGSSAPEIAVSLNAAWSNQPGLAIGNALGSNITNIAFVLGITAIIKPLHVQSSTLRREFPILFMVTLVGAYMLYDSQLTSIEGWVLLGMLVVYVGWLIHAGLSKRTKDDRMLEEIVDELPEGMSNGKAILWLVVGMVVLQLSSRLLVIGAVDTATHLGISDVVIGLTIVAIGTSLPELAASVAGVLKDEHEMAIGNVIGSNIFNLLAVMSLPGIVVGVQGLDDSVFYRDSLTMIGLTVAMAIMAYGFRGKPGHINRWEGVLLFSTFGIWLTFVALSSIH
ncbi:calcium/sodium antiporter [Pleionea sp. CnH1-48]|uniref:calcium/sodium antiporter n=1 Tax=Pleionea sp. CnH1-48 TaxID=2954494 RepID=UPI002096DE94|nr:calcium/sodium antiporter [Pleionea sp. CnH1-48]MCO7224027.1 calcium/sodium antiporter [Pleionea sp. CnH1-48]